MLFKRKKGEVERLPDSPRKAEKVKNMVDFPFLILTLILVTIGLIMMFSASYPSAYQEFDGDGAYYFKRQLIWAIIGLAAMFFVSKLHYRVWHRLAVLILGAAIVLLVIVLAIGLAGGGAVRWIKVGPVTVQPSEIAKLGVVLMFSAMITAYREKMQTIKYGFVPFVAILAVVGGLLFLEPHLSATIIILVTGGVLMFVGGVKFKHLSILLLIAAIGVGFFLMSQGYAGDRLQAWLHPEDFAQTKGYQTLQSLYAIGSGGMFGLGFGRSRQKYLYLPEAQNDYIFAVVCEELGFVGVTLILLLFALLVIRGYWIAMHAPDRFSKLVAAGLTTLLALQIILNVGVVTNLFPPTGISLPFFSYGGTALMTQLAELGIILNISRYGKNNLM